MSGLLEHGSDLELALDPEHALDPELAPTPQNDHNNDGCHRNWCYIMLPSAGSRTRYK